MTRPEGCPSPAELLAFHRRSLPPESTERVTVHIETCVRCGAEIRGLDQSDGAITRDRREMSTLWVESPPIDDGGADGPSGTTPRGGRSEAVGSVIDGRYRIVEPIGEGGMGSVWMARQTEPVRRVVALKFIREGLNSRQVLARFGAERQALALMDHPNIAKVLDAGTTPAGQPYFVMELVKGEPITRYCDGRRSSLPDRLGLFVQAARRSSMPTRRG